MRWASVTEESGPVPASCRLMAAHSTVFLSCSSLHEVTMLLSRSGSPDLDGRGFPSQQPGPGGGTDWMYAIVSERMMEQ